MRKPLRALVLTTAIAGSAAVGVTSRADAQPVAVAVASAESACPYRYVVSDGKRNHVAVYASVRGSSRQGSIRPDQRFVVLFGSVQGAPDHVGSRQLTDRGWVTFPRPYLKADGPCRPASQSLQAATATFRDLSAAAQRALRDLGEACSTPPDSQPGLAADGGTTALTRRRSRATERVNRDYGRLGAF